MISGNFRVAMRRLVPSGRLKHLQASRKALSPCYCSVIKTNVRTQRYFASVVMDDEDPPEETPEKSDLVEQGEESSTTALGALNSNLRPSQVVKELDRHIVGQGDAKRAVAIAMRNRWRRMKLPDDLKMEVTPRNVLLVGPTGCGMCNVLRS